MTEYKKTHVKRIPLEVSPDKYSEIKQSADNLGEKVNEFIKKAIDRRIESGN